jgi:hypothetical protein
LEGVPVAQKKRRTFRAPDAKSSDRVKVELATTAHIELALSNFPTAKEIEAREAAAAAAELAQARAAIRELKRMEKKS